MRRRWQLERAGLVNFWYYHDEADFQFSQGRIIFRGPNGSGKSVTMQSFLPLVLDGDKRPWRLDPFGSKDRKIEYYLLLDEDSGITDRTGYLYLEFYHPLQERYLTIGIGLRARRNVSGVNFWGFAITDNRRVGKDLFLYERDYSQGGEIKIPLTKSRLEEVIGAGGQVVTEPGQYKKLVNNLLFGFGDLQAYQELLDLLIQLRSPKLSKDFKPTTIYEILTAALPALQEDDLRPLSEVLEDMDQISDRLEELAVHRKEAEVLDKAYNTYNEFLLFTESQRLLHENRLCDEEKGRQEELQTRLQGISENIIAQREMLGQLDDERQKVGIELETLRQSDAVEKQAELERLQEEKAKTQGEIAAANKRMTGWEERRDRGARDKARLSQQHNTNQQEQQDLIVEMETDARECEFLLHDLYHRQWEHGIKAGDPLWDAWKRDLTAHGQKLLEALEAARGEGVLKLRLQEADKDLSEARELRDKAEESLRRAEQDWERAQQEQQELLFAWRKGLVEMPLSDEAFQQVLHLLTKYPEISYEDVAAPTRDAYNQVYKQILQERANWEHRKEGHLSQVKELRARWQEWKEHKEPEPPRSEGKVRSRARRMADGEPGAPLYAVCEFREGVPEEQKAGLETALERAGLLDAWLSPGKVIITGENEEDVWVEAEPNLLAHTLADYLYPTPPEGGKLTAEFIDRVLRTIRVGDAIDSHTGAMVSEKGAFCLGPLAGQAVGKARAEYIGKETRRLTRLAAMSQLEELIGEEEKALKECEDYLLALGHREQALKNELERFPAGEKLYHASALLENRDRGFQNAVAEEAKRYSRFKATQNQWLEARNRLKQLMGSWSMPQTEQGINEALNSLRSYQGQYSELKGKWTSALTLEKALADAERDWAEAGDKVEEERDYLRGKEEWFNDLRTKISVYERLLQELGIYDIHQQIRELKERDTHLSTLIKECSDTINNKNVEYQVLEIEVQKSLEIVREREVLCQTVKESWLKEWNRRLTPDWQEVQFPDVKQVNDSIINGEAAIFDEAVLIKLAQRIRQQYRGKYEQRTRENVTNSLYDAFYPIRQTLHEYSPEQLADQETGRVLVVFMRDRQNPITPQHLLKELNDSIEEQRLLLDEKDRELYEQIIIHSVGKAIRQKIFRAEEWVRQMNNLMQQRDTSSGLKLRLKWQPRAAANENELDTAQLVKYLKTDADLLRDEQREQMISHFKSRISWAKRESEEHKDTLRQWINQLLDYRQWFRFTLEYEKGEQSNRELTDARFNVLSGGEKAMAMYIPLFAATYSRYTDSKGDAPKLISLDEAFAGVDDENMRDMFELLTQMDFDYMMTSQVLWGCYDTVPSLSIYEIFRPKDVGFVTLIRYYWNGYRRELVDELADSAANIAATVENEDVL